MCQKIKYFAFLSILFSECSPKRYQAPFSDEISPKETLFRGKLPPCMYGILTALGIYILLLYVPHKIKSKYYCWFFKNLSHISNPVICAGVTVYLAPLDSLPPGGQNFPGNLTPHPDYLHPRGVSCPGQFILPPTHSERKCF